MTDQLICDYCGAVKKEFSFVIGASTKKDWCMIYGTGKMACPNCYDIAAAEGSKAVDNYINDFNNKVRK